MDRNRTIKRDRTETSLGQARHQHKGGGGKGEEKEAEEAVTGAGRVQPAAGARFPAASTPHKVLSTQSQYPLSLYYFPYL